MSVPSIFTRAFLTAAFENFGLAGFFLLPLHLKEFGASEGQLVFPVLRAFQGSARGPPAVACALAFRLDR